jgi:hypothetical protein
MRKITLMILAALSIATINSFAGGTKPKAAIKPLDKCVKGGSCCKNQSRAAMLKAKAVKKA